MSSNLFAAGILEASASAFGGYAASLLLERSPGLAERYGRGALASWKTSQTQRVLELAVAVRAAEPELFVGRIEWSRQAFAARGHDESEIAGALDALAAVLREKLPPQALEPVERCLEAASRRLAEPARALPRGLDPDDEHERLALRYLAAVLEGEPRRAISMVTEAVEAGMPPLDATLKVLVAAQREIGRLWHEGKANVAEEHLVTATTQRLLAVLAHGAEPAPSTGRSVLMAAVPGNAHDVSIRMLADAFELDGWRVLFLGADAPATEIALAVRFFSVDLLVLSATLSTQLSALAAVIDRVRDGEGAGPRILVGGPAFEGVPELWNRLGADATAPTLAEALARARELVPPRVD